MSIDIQILNLVHNHLAQLDDSCVWWESDTQSLLDENSDIGPDELQTLFTSGKIDDLISIIEVAYWDKRLLAMQETPEFFGSGVLASESEKRLWLEFQESFCGFHGLDRVVAFVNFIGDIRNSSFSPYEGDLRCGVVDPKIFDALKYFDSFAKDYFCGVTLTDYSFGDRLAAVAILCSVEANWMRLIDSPNADIWNEAVLNGYIVTRENANLFEQLEKECNENDIKFSVLVRILLDICYDAPSLFMAGVKAAIESRGLQSFFENEIEITKAELEILISNLSRPQRLYPI